MLEWKEICLLVPLTLIAFFKTIIAIKVGVSYVFENFAFFLRVPLKISTAGYPWNILDLLAGSMPKNLESACRWPHLI